MKLASKNTVRISVVLPVEDYKLLKKIKDKHGFRSVPSLVRNWAFLRLEKEKQKGKFKQGKE